MLARNDVVNELAVAKKTVVDQGMVVHWSDQHSCLCSKDLSIYRFDYQSKQLKFLCRLPAKDQSLKGKLKDSLARSALVQLLRPTAGIGHLLQLGNGDILVVFDRIYLCQNLPQGYQVKVLPPAEFGRFATPLRGGLAVHEHSQQVYFGEYLNGHSRDIRIIRVDPQAGTTTCCWQFSRADIKHVHAIHYDRYRNRLWVLTGDTDEESAFYYSDDEFQTLHKFAGGSQQWRAIALLIYPDAIEWGMDAGQDAAADCINKIYRYHFATAAVTEQAVVGNPVYAAVALADGAAVMATTFEPKRLQATIPCAELWYRSAGGPWQCIAKFDYVKRQRSGVSLYGMVYLPRGELPANQIMATPVNSQTDDYCAMLLQGPFTNS
jgi:hypothetical protein